MLTKRIVQIALFGLMLTCGSVLAKNTCDMYGVSGNWQSNDAKVTINDGSASYHDNDIGGKSFDSEYSNVECFPEPKWPFKSSNIVHVKNTYKYQYGKHHDLWLKKIDDHRMQYRYSDSNNNSKYGELYRN
jgi:hypothetical protein